MKAPRLVLQRTVASAGPARDSRPLALRSAGPRDSVQAPARAPK